MPIGPGQRLGFSGKALPSMQDSSKSRGAARPRLIQSIVYAIAAGALTLLVASHFYGSLRLQTLYALHWASPERFDDLLGRGSGPWSAPLDDVFIHFDFARAAARGFPFEWIAGNGYSSGGTSLLYPFALAVGYWFGFRDLRLMEWAALVACVCIFSTLLSAKRLAVHLPTPAALLIPFGFLSVGALNWTLFSGMEVALLLALWGVAYVAYDDIRENAPTDSPRMILVRAGAFGLACGLTVATRPEGIAAVVVLILAVLFELVTAVRRSLDRLSLQALARKLSLPLVFVVLPSFAVLLGQAIANAVFTGESTAAGALVKLEIHDPYLTGAGVRDAWWFHVKYQVLRVTQYHFSDPSTYGWIVWLLAAAGLAIRQTRRPVALLWASAILWILLVALNGQVRWQNERYTMPAVAWILLAASLGTGGLLARAFELRRTFRGPLLAVATLGPVVAFAVHQRPRFREQVWFFGRAARNILDQHVVAGTRLRFELDPPPSRVLVGDAGAIPYVSDLPALDIIGLGGYRGLPFARATRQHVGAALELIERIPVGERPDFLAIYPGWWGELPLWFGTKIGEVPVRGNVICGGPSKVLYRADWSPFESSGRPFRLGSDERVVDSLDHADILSEREHSYRITGTVGHVAMKLLANPVSDQPVWDAGRVIPAGASERFRFSGLDPARPGRLVVRGAPTEPVSFSVFVDGSQAGALSLEPKDGWVEAVLELSAVRPTIEVRLDKSSRERILHHVFLVQSQ